MALSRPGLGGVRHRVAAYAALVRVPNLFTAPPDIVLGGALAVAAGLSVSLRATVGLAVTSVLLYAAGTTLNDYFDAPVDAEERPERPIPSGRVPRRTALALGLGFLACGVVVALAVAGQGSAVVAGLLALVILLYDGLLKGGPAGFLAMGSTRGLNVLLGATAAGTSLFTLPMWALAIPVVVATYIAAVTYMAAEEAVGVDRRAVLVAAFGVALATGAVFAVQWVLRSSAVQISISVALAVGFLAWTGRALNAAYANPVPRVVGPAIGTCVLGLVVLDAAFAAVAGVGWAVVTLAFLAPAVGLSRAFDVS